MKIKISQRELQILDSFEDYVAKGGDILTFAEYYNAANFHKHFVPRKEAILLALCEEYAITGNYDKIFQILNTIFSFERWKLKNFKRFMSCVHSSELLRPLYDSIKSLHENCKNYIQCT